MNFSTLLHGRQRQTLLHSKQLSVFTSLQQLSDQIAHSEKANLLALLTSLDPQRRCQMGLACPRLSNQDDRLALFNVFPTHQLIHQHPIQTRLHLKIKRLQRLQTRKASRFQTPLRRSCLAILNLPLRQLKQEAQVVNVLRRTAERSLLAFTLENRKLQLMQVMLQQDRLFRFKFLQNICPPKGLSKRSTRGQTTSPITTADDQRKKKVPMKTTLRIPTRHID